MPNFINSSQYLSEMEKDKKPHIQIISIFAQLKKYNFENYEQVQSFIKRNIRPAKELQAYSMDKIKKTGQYLKENANYKWTLETILKHIDEDLDSLEGKEPILILKTGEKIYDITRIKQLDKENRIIWDGNKWKENF